ncbi:GNAT family N-acetyltransferase [Glycomyces paridis]|uniref:GNAT family N-acetyltransferase n=1 Tax=Glycomyces paridis TaxID=2126555 RepID=A0A4S8PKA0_9ACTN|nr:GNAT family N-acetyltransferase [Glycomyces paridis]THV30135.1 GNAT family N-acetyltransferase [Glycomyces paridis]
MEFAVVEVRRPGAMSARVYRELFAPSFPAEELESEASVEAALDAGEGSLLVAVDEDGAPGGAAFGRWSEASRVQLLTYLAVDGRTRGHGVGGRLLREAVGVWRERYDPCLVVAEIESPDAPASEAHGDPRRRLAFYEAAGARVLDLPYFQPGIGGPAHRVPGMLLLALHVAPPFTPDGPDLVAAAPLRRFIVEYLEASEGKVGADAETGELLRALDRPGGVRLDAPGGGRASLASGDMTFGPPAPHSHLDVLDGLGLFEFAVGHNAFELRIGGDPIACDEHDQGGSIGWIAKRLVPQPDRDALHRPDAWVEPEEWDVLRQWLRHVEPGDDPAPLRPLVSLMESGSYRVSIQTLPYVHIRAADPAKPSFWYADEDLPQFGNTFIPTHHWPPPDREAVADYRARLRTGRAHPAVVLLTHPESAAYYVLDGHHKLAAYLALERDPVCVIVMPETERSRGHLSYLDHESEEYRFEENAFGEGVLALHGVDGASALRIGGKPFLVEGYTGSGTVDRLAVRSGNPWFRRKVRHLRDWLREPDQCSAAEMTRTIWRLLAPGRYGLRRWTPEVYYVQSTAERRYTSWYVGITTPDLGPVLVPTDQWPPPDRDAVHEYRRMIEDGKRPLVLTMRAGPAEDEEDAVAFIVDGHHKLAAYALAGVAPHCLDVAKSSEEVACAPHDLVTVVGGDPELARLTANLLRYLEKPT